MNCKKRKRKTQAKKKKKDKLNSHFEFLKESIVVWKGYMVMLWTCYNVRLYRKEVAFFLKKKSRMTKWETKKKRRKPKQISFKFCVSRKWNDFSIFDEKEKTYRKVIFKLL